MGAQIGFDKFLIVCYTVFVNKVMDKIVGHNLIFNWQKAVVMCMGSPTISRVDDYSFLLVDNIINYGKTI